MKRFYKYTSLFVVVMIVLWSLVWAVSPFITRMVLNDVLATQKIVLDDQSSVRLNLFLSRLTIRDLVWRRDEQQTFVLQELEVRYSLYRLFVKEAHIARVTLKGLETHAVINGEQIRVAGFDIPQSEGAATETDSAAAITPRKKRLPLAVSVPEIVFEDLVVNVSHLGHPHRIMLNRLSVQRTHFEDDILYSEFSVDADINDASLNLKGRVDYLPDGVKIALTVQGKDFDPSVYQYLYPETIQRLGAKIGLSSELQLELIQGKLHVASSASQLTVEQLNFTDALARIHMEHYQLTAKELDLIFNQPNSFSVSTQLSSELNKLTVDAQNGKGQLIRLAQLIVEKSTVSVSDSTVKVTLPRVTLNDMDVSTRQLSSQHSLPALAHIDSLAVINAELTESFAHLSAIELSGSLVQVIRDKQGELVSLVLPGDEASIQEGETNDSMSEHSAATEPESTSEKAFHLAVDRFALIEPARIQITDATQQPEFNKTILIHELEITDVDSRDLEKRAQFHVAIKDEQYLNYLLSGSIQPFKPKVNLELDSKLTEFSLNEVSSYIEQGLGFEVEAGQLDSTVKGEIIDSILDTKVVVHLQGASFTSGSANGTEHDDKKTTDLIGQASVPLNVALGMLKDGEGNIELTIPVSGDLNDPSFGLHYVMGLVVQKAVMSAAKDYLLTTFLPYAQVIKVGMAAGSYALKVRFDDLVYSPAQLEPGAEQQVFIEQFVSLLKDKTDLRVKICPISVPEDLGLTKSQKLSSTQRKELLDFASNRSAAFKNQMVEKGIASKRLLLCVPDIERDKESKPRLVLSI